MTYVELVVVLLIFAMITSVVMFNYGDFQQKVDLRNLGSDLAIKIVEAQKRAMAGQRTIQYASDFWKPAYGAVFVTTAKYGLDDSSFAYFADINNNKLFDDPTCILPASQSSGECLDKIYITKGNKISSLRIYFQDNSFETVNELNIVFTRPDSGASIREPTNQLPVAYAQITILSKNGISDKIKVYPSGRIELE